MKIFHTILTPRGYLSGNISDPDSRYLQYVSAVSAYAVTSGLIFSYHLLF